ncbi:hypothetical protein ZHAS_00004467 [Anopheles sinensis]|uniref:Uncharacterized protein n=1 Tax=Anopheles sinensis TaxID=74873 RepID=A0A084VGV5_ANOSI|nr:hypothetical protein ZHAS_00004467 [Anopheles sinensis]
MLSPDTEPQRNTEPRRPTINRRSITRCTFRSGVARIDGDDPASKRARVCMCVKPGRYETGEETCEGQFSSSQRPDVCAAQPGPVMGIAQL